MQKGLALQNLKFFSGLRNYEESNSVPIDKVYYARNARFSNFIISSKKGYETLGDNLTGGTKFNGLFNYRYFSAGDTEERLLGFYDSKLWFYDRNTTTWDDIGIVWPGVADEETEGILYNNVMYFINPMTSAVDGIGKLDDMTFTVVPDSPRGFAIESWVERLWVIGDEDAPNAVAASRAATLAHPEYVEEWDTTMGAEIELIGKGGRNVAIRVLNNELYVWKEDSIWYNTTDRIAAGDFSFIEMSRTGGAVNQKSTIVVENDVWFLSKSKGRIEVRSLGTERNLGQNPRTRELTSIIQRTMRDLDPDQSAAVMSYNERIVKVHLRTLNSPSNNVTIVYDYDTLAFSVDRGQSPFRVVEWNDEIVYTEDAISGQAYLDEIGYSANGAAFIFETRSPFIDDQRPDTSKRARYLYIRGKQSYNQPVTIRLFREDYDTYSDYVIESPADRGVSMGSVLDDGQFGGEQFGESQFGGDALDDGDDIEMYRIQNDPCGDWLISIDRRCNMFAVGAYAEVNGGKLEIEQVELKWLPDNENYKRVNQ